MAGYVSPFAKSTSSPAPSGGSSGGSSGGGYVSPWGRTSDIKPAAAPTPLENHLVSSFQALDQPTRAKLLSSFKTTAPDKYALLAPHAGENLNADNTSSKGVQVPKASLYNRSMLTAQKAGNSLVGGLVDFASGSSDQGAGETNVDRVPLKKGGTKVVNVDAGSTNSIGKVASDTAVSQAEAYLGVKAGGLIIKGGMLVAANAAAEKIIAKAAPAQISKLRDILTASNKEDAAAALKIHEANAGAPKGLPAGEPVGKGLPAPKVQGQSGGVIRTLAPDTKAKLDDINSQIVKANNPDRVALNSQGKTYQKVMDSAVQKESLLKNISREEAHTNLMRDSSPAGQAYQRAYKGLSQATKLADGQTKSAGAAKLNDLLTQRQAIFDEHNSAPVKAGPDVKPPSKAEVRTNQIDQALNDYHNGKSDLTHQQATQLFKERQSLTHQGALDQLAEHHATQTGQPVAVAHEHLAGGQGDHAPLYQAVKDSQRVAYDLPVSAEELPKPETFTPSAGSPAATTGATKQIGGLAKSLRSGEGLLKRMGAAGKTLAGKLDKQYFDANAIANQYHNAIPTVLKLSKTEARTLFNVVEHGAWSPSAKVNQAAKEWKALSRTVLADAKAHGVDVHDLGENYMPHDLSEHFKSKDSRARAAQQLVKSGTADNLGHAHGILNEMEHFQKNGRKFGNLDKSRRNSPLEYKTDVHALTHYLDGAAERISQAKHFGSKDETANRLLSQIGADGHDISTARDIFDYHVGNKLATDNKAWKTVRGFEAATKLGRASISNLTQINNTQTLAGPLRAAKGAWKVLRSSKADFEYLDKTGVTGSHAVDKIRSQEGGLSGKAASVVMPFFNRVETFNRNTAALTGRSWADKLAAKGGASHQLLRDVLGVEGDIGKKLTEEQQIQASRELVKKTQFLVGSKDLPAFATKSGAGRAVFQFRSFSYKQQQFLADSVLKPAAHGDFMPLARYVAGTALLGGAAYKARTALNNTDTSKQTEVQKIANLFQASGGFGITLDSLQNFYESSGYDHPGGYERTLTALAALVGGPIASDVTTATARGKDVADYLKGQSTYGLNRAGKFAAQHIPVLGPRVANSGLFNKDNVPINDKTFTAMPGPDKVNYLLKGKQGNLDKLLNQTNDKGVTVRQREIQALVTDRKTIDGLLNPTAKELKAGVKPVTMDQIKQALTKLGYNDSNYSDLMKQIKAGNKVSAKQAAITKAKNKGNLNPVTGRAY